MGEKMRARFRGNLFVMGIILLLVNMPCQGAQPTSLSSAKPTSNGSDPQELPLRDILLPDAPSWWPPAPGWWLLLGAWLVVSLVLAWLLVRKKHNRYAAKSIALRQLQDLENEFQASGETLVLVQGLSALLRRTVISLYPRTQSASLTGQAWLDFLDRVTEIQGFTIGPGKFIADAPYRSQSEFDAKALIRLCRDWIHALPRKPSQVRE